MYIYKTRKSAETRDAFANKIRGNTKQGAAEVAVKVVIFGEKC